MQVTNCVAPNQPNNPRRGARRSRHLRRVQRPRQGGSEMRSFPYRNRFKFPFLSDYFLKNELYVHRPAPKKGPGKRCDRQTDKQTDRIGPILSSSGTVFGPAKSQIPLADASKGVPKTTPQILLGTRLMGTSGLPRSLHSPQVAPAAQKFYPRDSVLADHR